MINEYSQNIISENEALSIAKSIYDIEGDVKKLDGEIDFNFKIKSNSKNYILKISRPNSDYKYLEFQSQLLDHLSSESCEIECPKIIKSLDGKTINEIFDKNGQKRFIRLLTWIDGRLFSSVNPITNELLYSLGEKTGELTKSLQSFNHEYAQRKFDWDIAQAKWTNDYIHLFNNNQKKIINYFLDLYSRNYEQYNSLRKSVIHNDANDNNIIVSDNKLSPKVKTIIDYGDAIFTQTINDLAVCIAYGVMNKPDALSAAKYIVKGYNDSFAIKEEELEYLYILVAIRLIISVTKSAINKKNEPDNKYLLISEKPAWDVLTKWFNINERLAQYTFREACGYSPYPKENLFNDFVENIHISLNDFFPTLNFDSVRNVDMSVSSTFIGNEYNNNDLLTLKLKQLELENPNKIIAGGYQETRPLYITDDYKKEGNEGPEYRSVHLGVDFWVDSHTPLNSPFDGKVFSICNNSNDKDYGPTIIIEHNLNNDSKFYTLYGHLSKSSLKLLKEGQLIKKGDQIGFIGNSTENGNWSPHLHFQIILDMLGNKNDFPGVAYPEEINVWKSLCPNPNLLFRINNLDIRNDYKTKNILEERKKFLGKSLSISYNNPLHIVRGSGQYLIDINGRKYLDTVNNVAHVGHEHPEVVKAGQAQMALLNTNTRYLHENIVLFAEELLSTFPKELSVVHFVNSGSEANELALRMAKVFTNQKDIIAVEVGYHGNTSGCIDVSSYKFDGKGGKGAPEHTHIVPLPDSYRGIYCGKNSGLKYAEYINEQLKNIKTKNRNIAAFICESIISCGGQIELPENYLKQAYQFIHAEGGVCIADEIQVGCGRVGKKFWGFELHDVIPDIVTIGKPIGNGHPLAAVVCKQEIADAFNNGMEYFNTFGGNPVSCAIGNKVLQIIKEENLQQNALEVGNYLKQELKVLQSKFPIIGDVRGQGLFLGFELVNDQKHPETKKASYLANRMRDLGILMSTDGKDNNVLKIKPPLVFTKENSDELIKRLTQVFNEDFMRN